MFDPTIFENLKVAFENHIYDLDNITGQIEVINRKDYLDMAVMSRELALEFKLMSQNKVSAEVVLKAGLKDLSAEILETPGTDPGCTLLIYFYKKVRNVTLECQQIDTIIEKIWKPVLKPTQTLSFTYKEMPNLYLNKIELTFNRLINEEQIGDIPELIDHVMQTLLALNKVG
ncbi:hypothetical protein [Halalkalibacter alkalisediminis]|uniref:Uncharacterized protein n=1 Tax=Halalkalibacter alkalisediminis TaxID=935616 RepID=A0ABV6NDV3_9BACI|nr:hypothetical protein [Halalkalibacter alkalisediminis]